MEIDFQKLMTNKSDESLQEYIEKRASFNPQTVNAAIAEMQKRGRIFSDEELTFIRQEFQARQDATEKEETAFWSSGWKKNVVTDTSAPAYYSEIAIYMFSVFFTVIFGATLLAINCNGTESRKGVWQVIAFGFAFIGLQFWLLSLIPTNTGLALVFNMAGALLMNQFFWKKYIGKDTKYRTKPIWKPLAIGIAVLAFLIFVNIFAR